MSRQYDSRTTTFSPDGRLFQVEYAVEAINQAGASVGIVAKDGIIIAAEKKITSKLLAPPKSSEKIYKIDDHIYCAVAGLTSDANILLNLARRNAGTYSLTYQEDMPMEQLIKQICNYKQLYTQYGGQRPFGVSFLYAGWDRHHGFQLYHSDPSGYYGGWKATAIGNSNQSANSLLKTDYEEDMSVSQALLLAAKVLAKTMDSTAPSADKMEFCTVTKNEKGDVVCTTLTKKDAEALIAEVSASTASAGDV